MPFLSDDDIEIAAVNIAKDQEPDHYEIPAFLRHDEEAYLAELKRRPKVAAGEYTLTAHELVRWLNATSVKHWPKTFENLKFYGLNPALRQLMYDCRDAVINDVHAESLNVEAFLCALIQLVEAQPSQGDLFSQFSVQGVKSTINTLMDNFGYATRSKIDPDLVERMLNIMNGLEIDSQLFA